MTLNQKPDIWQKVISRANLDIAWEKVRANRGAAGGDRVTVGAFQTGADRRLAVLRQALLQGEYRPSPYRAVDIPKRKGGIRRLLIPSVIDRVVHSALAQVLSPILDEDFEENSFAYRPGRSVQQAVRAVARFRDEGYWHVIEADIVGFFDAVRHEIVLGKLATALTGTDGADAVLDLVALLLEHQSQDTGCHGKGLAQGSPLSPLLANLYLDDLDEEIHGRGIRIVRFADDFVVLCKKREAAAAALREVTEVLAEHGLDLHESGTRILDFDRGFEFLGALFVRSMVMHAVSDPEEDAVNLLRQASEEDEALASRVADETAAGYDRGSRVLYLTERGRRVALRNQSFSVLGAGGREIAGISHGLVDRIEFGPGTGAGMEVIEHALATQTDLAIVDGFGTTVGQLVAPLPDRGEQHLAQAALVLEPEQAVTIARELVEARIRNQRTQLFRSNRGPDNPEVTAALARMQRHLRKLPQMETLDELRGMEGVCAAEFWPALGLLTNGAANPMRRQRPAREPVNAAINYLTAILERDMRTAVLAAGLHPGFGTLHASRDRADACVWDLMEPFRAPLTEGLASYLFNARRLRPEMFTQTATGIRIAREGRQAIIRGYETAVSRRVNARGRKVRLAWRPMMKRQAQDLAGAARAGDPALFHAYLMEP